MSELIWIYWDVILVCRLEEIESSEQPAESQTGFHANRVSSLKHFLAVKQEIFAIEFKVLQSKRYGINTSFMITLHLDIHYFLTAKNVVANLHKIEDEVQFRSGNCADGSISACPNKRQLNFEVTTQWYIDQLLIIPQLALQNMIIMPTVCSQVSVRNLIPIIRNNLPLYISSM